MYFWSQQRISDRNSYSHVAWMKDSSQINITSHRFPFHVKLSTRIFIWTNYDLFHPHTKIEEQIMTLTSVFIEASDVHKLSLSNLRWLIVRSWEFVYNLLEMMLWYLNLYFLYWYTSKLTVYNNLLAYIVLSFENYVVQFKKPIILLSQIFKENNVHFENFTCCQT